MKEINHLMHNWIIHNVQGTCEAGYIHKANFNKEFGITDPNDPTFYYALSDAEVFLYEDWVWYCKVSEHTNNEIFSGSIYRDCCPGEFN